MIKLVDSSDSKSSSYYPSFTSLEIPDVTVLTGPNGSGKSQFLAAIKSKKIKIEHSQDFEILAISRDNITPELRNELPAAQDFSTRLSQVDSYLSSTSQEAAANLFEALADGDIESWLLSTALNPWAEHSDVETNKACRSYAAKMRGLQNDFRPTPGKERQLPSHAIVFRTAQSSGKFIHHLKQSDFESADQIIAGYSLERSLVSTYESYVRSRARFVLGRIRDLANEDREFSVKNLMLEFERITTPPWKYVDEAIASFLNSTDEPSEFQFSISNPGNDTGDLTKAESYSFTPNLSVNGKHSQPFASLSSGEAAVLFLTIQIVSHVTLGMKKCLFLLDEVDASLHPSLQKFFLAAVRVIAENSQSKFIIATHSPTTVAYSPSDTVLCFDKSGKMKTHSLKDKADAIDLLTDGFVTLNSALRIVESLNPSELAVFSEGHNAKILERYFQLSGFKNCKVVQVRKQGSGDSQLLTLYRFMRDTLNNQPVLFVLDCDIKLKAKKWPPPTKAVTFFVLPQFPMNPVPTGIENAFDETVVRTFLGIPPEQNVRRHLTKKEKQIFAMAISESADLNDFSGFDELGLFIRSIQ